MSKPEAPRKAGRPSSYTPEIADAICARLMEGGSESSLRRICSDPDMPAISTVMLWVRNHAEFEAKYRLAREVQADVDFDDLRDIASTPLIGTKTITKGGKVETVVGDNVERSKLILHEAFWSLARRNAKKFGDKVKQEHSGPDGGPIQVSDASLTDAERLAAITAIFNAARTRAPGHDPEAAEDLGGPAGTTDSGV